jgi:VCBS repeat-containing protein
MNHRTPTRLAVLAALATLGSTALAEKQTWDYKSAMKDPVSGQYSKTDFRHSTVTVEEKDGKATFRMITAGRGDPCISQSELPAEVQRDEQLTTVTVTPPLVGCEPFRYLIRNDGSGGVRQVRRNERWVNDGFDHGLTPRK